MRTEMTIPLEVDNDTRLKCADCGDEHRRCDMVEHERKGLVCPDCSCSPYTIVEEKKLEESGRLYL